MAGDKGNDGANDEANGGDQPAAGSPWGGGSVPPAGPGKSAQPGSSGEPPAGQSAPGPRNPWLPGGGRSGPEGPRRPASIEDLFRKRGGGPGP
ncbi:hypothetical protein ACNJUL_21200, partial [Mycobacterium tuberculosis]